MQKSTINRLNQLNQQFYEVVAKEFDETRKQPWNGWEKLIANDFFAKFIAAQKKLFVLDIGCGNGRFAEFLAENQFKLRYLGIDTNEKLLNLGLSKALFQQNEENLRLEEFDIVENLLEAEEVGKTGMDFGEFDLVVAFGVLHHLPSFELRKNFFKMMAKQIADDGLVVVTAWRFDRDENLMKRKINFESQGIEVSEIENNDYLLDWQRGASAVRYCHLVLPEEMKDLIKNSGLRLMEKYSCDGKSGDLNDYYLCKREN